VALYRLSRYDWGGERGDDDKCGDNQKCETIVSDTGLLCILCLTMLGFGANLGANVLEITSMSLIEV